MIIKGLKPLLNIPDFQFGFRNNHSTIDQVHRIKNVIEQALEQKKYCPAVFLDVPQARRVNSQDEQNIIGKLLPAS